MRSQANGQLSVSNGIFPRRATTKDGFFIFLLLIALVFFASCSETPVTAQNNEWRRASRLRVAVVTAPPISSFSPESRQPEGYAVDIMRLIARNSNLELEFLPSDWSTMGAALASRKADLVVGPIFMTEARAAEFSFSKPLFAYAIVAVVAAENPKITSFEDLKNSGIRIAVGRGGFDSQFVERNMPNAEANVFPPDDPTLPMLEIVAGRADVALVDYATARRFVAENTSVTIGLNQTPVSLQYAAFMLRSGDLVLHDFLNVALQNLELAGEMSELDQKYSEERSWYGRANLAPRLVQ